MFKVNDNFVIETDKSKYGEIIKKEDESTNKFDYIIANPPYQLSNNGNQQIWPLFINQACKISNYVTMIHPGRWINPKKFMERFRDDIISNGLYYFIQYPDSKEIFPEVKISGGLSITCYKNSYQGEILWSCKNNYRGTYNKEMRAFENDFEEEAYTKVWSNNYFDSIKKRTDGGFGGSFSGFGYKRETQMEFLSTVKENDNYVPCWSNSSRGKGMSSIYKWYYVDKNILDDRYKKATVSRKVMISSTGKPTKTNNCVFTGEAQIVPKDATAAYIFFIFPEMDTDYHLNLIKSYLESKTVRFLMYITKKDVYVKGFENVPDYVYFIDKLNGELFTDEFLYKQFGFSKELIEYIENIIKTK